jgi:hypothetical protein
MVQATNFFAVQMCTSLHFFCNFLFKINIQFYIPTKKEEKNMSFFTSNRSEFCPGPICGNPLNGLCERVCIETKKVYDSCIRQIELFGTQAVLVNLEPPAPAQPLAFTSSTTTPGEDAEIVNLVIERFEETPNFARVRADIIVPITVNYIDASDAIGSGETTVIVTQDVILFVPQPSIVPFEVKAFASAVCADGAYLGNNTFSLDLCITIILKIVAKVELLIPTYGYCQIPPCQEFNGEGCSTFFNLPLYPEPQFN